MGSVGPERDVTGLYFRMLILLELSVYGAYRLTNRIGNFGMGIFDYNQHTKHELPYTLREYADVPTSLACCS